VSDTAFEKAQEEMRGCIEEVRQNSGVQGEASTNGALNTAYARRILTLLFEIKIMLEEKGD